MQNKNKKNKVYLLIFSIVTKTTPRTVKITTTHPAVCVTINGIHLIDNIPSIIPNPTARETKTPASQTTKAQSPAIVVLPELDCPDLDFLDFSF